MKEKADIRNPKFEDRICHSRSGRADQRSRACLEFRLWASFGFRYSGFGFTLLIALFTATSFPASALADTVTVTSTADAGILQLHPDSNQGGFSPVVSGTLGAAASFENRRIVLRFDLGGRIPPGAVVNSVSVKVVVVLKVPLSPANSNFGLRRLLQPWNELDVTWNSRTATNAWEVPGADGATDSLANPSSDVFVTGTGTYMFPSTAAVVADVQAWVDNPGTNAGWLLYSESEGTARTARHFATREDPANTPVLVVTYSLP